MPIIPLIGRAKLSGSQVIDADYILSLIGSKVKFEEGLQTFDGDDLKLIETKIQELSDMGEDEQAKLLREFVEDELVPKKAAAISDFYEVFSEWKKGKIKREVEIFAEEWGIDKEIVLESYLDFSLSKKDYIPYSNEISGSLDYSKVNNKKADSQLGHVIALTNNALPNFFLEMNKSINSFLWKREMILNEKKTSKS